MSVAQLDPPTSSAIGAEIGAEVDPEFDPITTVAHFLIDIGRVAPSLAKDGDGRFRSWWLPLPAMGDRQLIASLLQGDGIDDHLALAQQLAVEVDTESRRRLVVAGARLVPRRSGRRTVPAAWLESLTSADPYLSAALDSSKLSALSDVVGSWVSSGAVAVGRALLCLRVHEPPDADVAAAQSDSPDWLIELLVQDGDEPSLVLPLADVWQGRSPFAPAVIEQIVASLGRMAMVAPELAELLEEEAPTSLRLDTSTLLSFVHERSEPLAEVGITVLLPGWWSRRGRLSMRARAKSTGTGPSGVVTEGGFGLDEMLSFSWEAALGDRRLTKAEISSLSKRAAAKQELVRIRGEWVQLDASELTAMIGQIGARGTATAGELLRVGLGLGDLGVSTGVRVSGVIATGWLGNVLDEALHSSVAPIPTPTGFLGQLRPYQERGVGWLVFLGRLGLGACLADDMGLGKTAQLIATLLADPVAGPTLVVCPVSVLGNWARELERFTPQLTVMVHHGGARHSDAEPFADRAGRHDVVLSTYSLIARDSEHLGSVQWGRVVLDEAQQLKNPGTKLTRAVAALDSSRRVALTGTPVENRLSELWSLMHVLNPGLLGSLASFTESFAGPIERDHDEEATELLRRATGPFMLRRLKTDRSIIDDLPEKIEQTEHCVLSQEQATLYQAVVDELLEASERAEGIARSGLVLAGISKLKQVCNHPAHFLRDGSALSGRSGKLDRVEELLDEIVDSGDKVLCFTQFVEWGDLLVPHLTRRYGAAPLWLHGSVKRSRREEMMAEFQLPDGPQIFLLSLKAGGTG